MLTQEQLDDIISRNNLLDKPAPVKQDTGLRGSALFESLVVPQPSAQPIQQIQPEQKPGFFERIKSKFGERVEEVEKIVDKPQTLASKSLQVAGEAAGSLFDIGFETLKSGLSAITPDFIEEPVKANVKKALIGISNTEAGEAIIGAIEQGAEFYQSKKEEYPETANNIEALLNIAAIVPAGKAGTVVTKRLGQKVGTAATKIEKGAKSAIDIEKQNFIRNLVKPLQTKKIKEAQVARTTETGKGIFKRSVIEPTAQELSAEKALLKIDDISSKNTVQQNFNIVQENNKELAKKLTVDLENNNFIYNQKQLLTKLNQAKEKLIANPAIVGDAEKTADKLIAEIQRRVVESKKTGADLLQVRKEFDIWVKSQKGANIFDPSKENAFSIANREIRQSINDFVDTRATVDVKNSLREQSNLFSAMENLTPKAALEADTAFGRTLQKAGNILGTKNKIVQGLAAAVGIGGLGAAATFAPAAAALGVTGFLVYRGGKLIMSPKIRLELVKVLKEIERISKITTDTRKLKQLKELEDEIRKLPGNEAGFASYFGNPKILALEDTLNNLTKRFNKATDQNLRKTLDKEMQRIKRNIENTKLDLKNTK